MSYMGYDQVGNQVLTEGPEESDFVGLYFRDGNDNEIERIAFDGTGRTAITTESLVDHLAVDLTTPGGKLYWIGLQNGGRCDLDGTNKETILDSSDVDTPGPIVIDTVGRRLYYPTYTSPNGEIRTTDLQGNDRQTVLSLGNFQILGMAFDPVERKLYYTKTFYPNGDLRRCDLDGSNDELILGSLSYPWGVAVDPIERKLYWVEATAARIRRSNLDGSSSETIVSGLSFPSSLGLDPVRKRIYWADNTIESADLDGSAQSTVLNQFGNFALSIPRRVTVTSYDGLNRVTHVKDALFATTYMGYDSRSSAVLRVDADGRATYMAYDPARRLERQWFANPVETADSPIYFSYDQVGNLLSDLKLGLGTSTYEYDDMNRLTKKVTPAGGIGAPVYYEYDLSGMKTSVKDSFLAESVYVHDVAGRLEKVNLDAGRTSYFTYDDAGLMTRRTLPATQQIMAYYTYDDAGRLARLENRGPTFGDLVNYFSHERNPNGAIAWIRHEGDENTYYEYDALDRLTLDDRKSTSATVYGFRYAYDEAGNRTRKVTIHESNARTYYEYDARNLLGTEWVDGGDAAYYIYDVAQRMKSREVTGTGQSSYFTHDQQSQATRIEFKKASGADSTQSLGYNGVGDRVNLFVGNPSFPSEVNFFSSDGSKLLNEFEVITTFPDPPTATLRRRYRHNDQAQDATGSLIELEPNGAEAIYPCFDHRGTAWRFRNDGGELQNKYYFDAFGNQLGGIEDAGASPRLRFVTPGFVRLAVNNMDLFLLGGGCWLPKPGRITIPGGGGGSTPGRGFGWHNQVSIVDGGDGQWGGVQGQERPGANQGVGTCICWTRPRSCEIRVEWLPPAVFRRLTLRSITKDVIEEVDQGKRSLGPGQTAEGIAEGIYEGTTYSGLVDPSRPDVAGRRVRRSQLLQQSYFGFLISTPAEVTLVSNAGPVTGCELVQMDTLRSSQSIPGVPADLTDEEDYSWAQRAAARAGNQHLDYEGWRYTDWPFFRYDEYENKNRLDVIRAVRRHPKHWIYWQAHVYVRGTFPLVHTWWGYSGTARFEFDVRRFSVGARRWRYENRTASSAEADLPNFGDRIGF